MLLGPLEALEVIPRGPSPQGSLGTHPGSPSHSCPRPLLGKGRGAPAVFSARSWREKSCNTGVRAAQALGGEEGDLSGGDRGQGEGGGGVGPEDPVQQLLLLLLELPP